MAVTIEQQLNQLQIDKETLVANLNTQGITVTNDQTFTELVPKVLDIQGGDTSVGNYYDPFDVKTILENDTENYPCKVILLIPASVKTIDIKNNEAYACGYKGSDGQSEFHDTKTSMKWIPHEEDYVINKMGIKMRWIILYCSNNDIKYLINWNVSYNSYKMVWSGVECQSIGFNSYNASFVKEVDFINGAYIPNTSFNPCGNRQSSSIERTLQNNEAFPNVTTLNFSQAYNITEIGDFDFKNITTISNTGSNLLKLTKIGKVSNIGVDLNVSQSYNLEYDSIINLFNGLIDLTGQTALTLTIGTRNLEKVSDEEKAIVTNKNWILK